MKALQAEWTKFRTVRGWVLTAVIGVLLVVAFGVFPGMSGHCEDCSLPAGPDGEEVTDAFGVVHRTLDGDGSLTVRVATLTGRMPSADTGGGPAREADGQAGEGVPGLVPWAKAGLIVKASLKPGAPYAAIMLTGGHGVRFQYNYLHDVAGPTAAAPAWLRLTRSGPVVTGYSSADGSHWNRVGSARLEGLPTAARAGVFATSPPYNKAMGTASFFGGPSQATAQFDRIATSGGWQGPWTGATVGTPPGPVGATQIATTITVSGAGDIAPAVAGVAGMGVSITQTLIGTFIGLIALVVLGTVFVTTEYRRGLIRVTQAALPRRSTVLAAKAGVLALVAVVSGLVAAGLAVPLGRWKLESNGIYVHAASIGAETRLVIGTALLLGLAALLALALGFILRRSAAAVATAIVVIVLPYVLAISVLPAGAGRWALEFTPAAGFAIQQTVTKYPQVDGLYLPGNGFFPLSPWAGLAVLAAWALAGLALAGFLLRRRDA
jgi:hypothetical protein